MENIIKFRFRVRRKGNGVEAIDFFYFTMDMLLGNFLSPFKKYEEYEILSIDRFINQLDKNGVEMYENDVARYMNFANMLCLIQHSPLHSRFDMDIEAITKGLAEASVIIGNIHETPELKNKLHKS